MKLLELAEIKGLAFRSLMIDVFMFVRESDVLHLFGL